MPDIKVIFTRSTKYLFFLLALFVLGWGFTTYQTVFAGLILGTTISFFNLWLLYRKSIKLSEAVANGRTVYSLGSISRLASAALVVLIAIRYPEYFNILSSIIGIMTTYFVIIIDLIFLRVIKGKQQEER
ncbi:ATP synthase subunit I [Caldibacillus lycopersici]|uniref:ATP synthase subunit I n=1 Tax=Perspicuibacillus lycopersici TaxID=1325689 RepID=A0AAE3LSZ6_9BACI|nr:ATP synthase subunit I [Perspicuibacillus lycopersici]MCU9613303.1 ATP synthase subunit I [Perspicuibacillus lycopersici]